MRDNELDREIGICREAIWKLSQEVDVLKNIVRQLNEYRYKINRCPMCEKPLDNSFLLEYEPLCKCWRQDDEQ
jgi:3-polyprenyl-4-hydroxybenzoate decarboxylase